MGDLILGIDPGLDGAVALLDVHSGELVEVFDVPTLQLKNRRELDEYGLARIVDEWSPQVTEAWIEDAWPRPGEAATLAFQFGRNFGQMRGIVCANFIPLHVVVPAVWKRVMKVTGDKDESRKVASVTWPTQSGRWPAKKNHGRAEAALVAAYGRRQFLKEHGAREAA